jgi:hypothetical protein
LQAVQASRLEENHQIEAFGLVEGGHDVDEADLRTRVAGSALFLSMLKADGHSPSAGKEIREDVSKALDILKSMGL